LAEFQELGCRLEVAFHNVLTEEAADRLIDAFIDQVLVPRRLVIGGWLTSAYIVVDGRGSVTEFDRAIIQLWLASRSEVVTVHVGPLVDAYYWVGD
jgi:uncharacterized protein YggL (DUF469 family)